MAIEWSNGSASAVCLGIVLLLLSVALKPIKNLNRWLLSKESKRRYRELPPGALGWPLVGETLQFVRDFSSTHPETFTEARVAKYGSDTFMSHVMGNPVIMVNGLKNIKHVLMQTESLFVPDFPQLARKLLGRNGLVFQTGDYWKKIRRMVARPLFPSGLKLFMEQLEDITIASVEAWNGRVIQAHPESRTHTFKVIAKMMMSMDPGAEVTEFMDNFMAMIAGKRSIQFNFPGFQYRKSLQAGDRIDQMLKEKIAKRRQEGLGKHHDLLDSLLSTEEGDSPLSFDEIAEQVKFVFVAGLDITGDTIAFVMAMLLDNQDLFDKLKAEHEAIRSRIGVGTKLSWSDYKDMTLTHKVIHETLRIITPAPLIYRSAVQDTHMDGFWIPKGFQLILNFRMVHLDAKLYPDPYKFDVSRWETNPPVGAYLPFGMGPKSCPGQELAMLEVCLALHHIVTKFRWEAAGPVKYTYFPGLAFKGGLPLKITSAG